MKPALLFYPHISSYPVLLLLGFFFGWLLARSRARFYGIFPRDVDNILLILPLAALFGARLFARLFYAKLPLWEALKVWEGDGLVFYGGFVFGVGAVLFYGTARKLRLLNLIDCVAPSVALGLAFGRVGCFLAGCCWGDVCVDKSQLARLPDAAVAAQIRTVPALSGPHWPLAVRFPEKSGAFQQQVKLGLLRPQESSSLPVHPVQLYESVLAAVLCLLLCRRSWKSRAPGQISLYLLVGYAVIRFGTEFLRADNKVYALGLTFSQVVSIWILLFCAAWIAFRAMAARGTRRTAPEREPQLVSAEASGRSSSM